MNNFLLMIGALLAGVLAALAAVPLIIDWNSYRGVFEEEASRLMGRDVRVGGGVNLRILPVPYVRFEKLRIADTSSTGGDPLFRADSVTMQLSIAPFLRGVLEARSVELKRPSLRLVLDAEGRGNWRSLALKPGSLPFVPADVALQSVGIEGGTLILAGPSAKDIAELSGIAGELSADSFDGPFKFKGTADWYGESREIRVATTKPESDGVARLRVAVRVPSSLNTYVLDGRILDMMGRPHIDGDLTAKLRLSAGLVQAKSAAGDDPTAFDLKSKFDGNLKGAELTDIALSLDDPADPQLVTGTAKANWGEAVRFDVALASRSFNLDKLTSGGNSGNSDPLEKARGALNAMLAALPADAETEANLKADRITLGGEAVSGVTVAINRRGSTLDVRALKAMLPGSTRLEASGTLARDAKLLGFSGPMSLRGANLARFLAWSRKSGVAFSAAAGSSIGVEAAGGRYDGPFGVEGQLEMTGGRFELTHAIADISGQAVAGEFRIATEGRHKIGVVLEGDRIDAAQFWPGGFDGARLREILTGPASGTTTNSRTGLGLYGFNPDTADLTVEIRAGELQLTPSTNLRSVDATFAIAEGELSMPRLRFATSSGLAVDLDGELSGLAQSQPKAIIPTANVPAAKRRGELRWTIDAATPQAISELLNSLDWPAGSRPADATFAAFSALAPMRLAGSTLLGASGPQAVDVTLDGSVDGGRVTSRARFDQGIEAWTTAPLDAMATIETGDIGRWLALAAMSSNTDGRWTSGSRAGRIVIKAEGQPRAGVTALATVTSDGLSVVYQGQAALPKDGEVALEGTVAIAARDAADAFGLAGIALGQGSAAVPFTGSVSLKLSAGALNLATTSGKLGPSNFNGTVSLQRARASAEASKPPVREFAATIAMDSLTLPGLLSAISDRRQAADDRGRWPDQPLKLGDTLSGRIKLKTGLLGIDGPIALKNAAADIVLAPGSAIVESLTANGLGGKVSARLALTPAAGSVGLTGDWTLADANLSALSQGASAPVSMSVSLKGQGLSGSGLIASLSGSGEATIGAGQVKGVSPAAVASTIDAALASKEPLVGDGLTQALKQSLGSSSLPVRPRKFPFTVANGVVKLPRTPIDSGSGLASLEGSMDLNLLKYTADWRLEAAAKASPSGVVKPPLPAVVLSYGDALAAVASEGKLSLGSFEQELVIRKVEHDSEELERLRKLDEERRKKDEAERLKAVEAAAAAAAAVGPVSAPVASEGMQSPRANQSPQSGSLTSGNAPQQGAVNATTEQAEPQEPAQTPSPPPPAPASANGVTRQAPQTSGAVNRRRTPDGIPQPFNNNF